MPSSASVGSVTGLLGYLSSSAVTEPLTSQSSSNEGIDKLTVAVPTAGFYRVSAYLAVNVASDAATSDAGVCQVAYSNGTAQSAADIKPTGVTIGTFSLKGAAGTNINQSMVLYCAAGTTIVMTVASTISGAKTVGKFDIRFAVEQIS